MQQYVFAVFNGVASGMAIFLVAAGVTLIFGVLKIMNFSHGAFFMLGAYICFTLLGENVPSVSMLLLGSLVAGAVVALCGIVVNKIILSRLRGLDEHYVLIATFALMLVVNGAVKLIWGVDYYAISPPPALQGAVHAGDFFIPTYSIFVIVVGVLIFVSLDLGLNRLWIGKVLQSLVNDSWIVGLLGYNVTALYTILVALAFFLAGLAGGVLLPNQSLSLGLADNYLLLGFITCIIGGLGNVRGAFVTAILIGLTESVSSILVTDLPGVTVYVGMVLVLLLRPNGLFQPSTLVTATPAAQRSGFWPRRSAPQRSVPQRSAGRGMPGAVADLRFTDQGVPILLTSIGLALASATLSLPLWANPGVVFIAGLALIEALLALSWNFLFGYTGVVSFGHAAFFALGAYGVGYLAKFVPQMPFLAALAAAAIAGGALAALVGGIALRRASGIYLAILTMALAEICRLIISSSTPLGRDDGLSAIPRPTISFGLFKLDLTSGSHYFWFICACVALFGCLLWWLVNSRFGRVLRSINQDPERTSFMGVDVARCRWQAFIISGTIATFAGGLSGPWVQIVTPDASSILHSTAPILNTLLGGAHSFWGPAIGSFAFSVISYSTRNFPGVSESLIGVILLVVVLIAPSGILGFLEKLEAPVSRWLGRTPGKIKLEPAPKSTH